MEEILKNKKIILFDGDCLICNKYILFIAKNDKKDIFRFMSLQNKKTSQIINLKKNKTYKESICLVENSNVKIKSEAIIFILSELNYPYKLAFLLLMIPKKIRDIVYIVFARNRYKLFGKTEYCSLINNNENLKNKIIH